MSRPFARIKLGYYPLPGEEATKIRSLIVASQPYCAIDPCAGDGTAIVAITKGTGGHLTAIEIDADRATACTQKGIPTVHGSAFECKVQSETCALLYLNPPYDTELGPHNNRRMESVFLEHCFRWLRTDGVLVFVESTCFGSNTRSPCGSTRSLLSARGGSHMLAASPREWMYFFAPGIGRTRFRRSRQMWQNGI